MIDGSAPPPPLTLEEQRFVDAFEACALPPSAFRHEDHVRLAWLLLRHESAPRALARFVTGLRRYASFHGAADKVHETITWAYLALIHERMARSAPSPWPGFAAAHPDLFDRALLRRYYREETLASPLARRVFVLPDRGLEGVATGWVEPPPSARRG